MSAHPSDAAKTLEQCDEPEICDLIDELPSRIAATVITVMDVVIASRCLEQLDSAKASQIIAHMTVDSGDLIIHRISPDKRSAILQLLPPELRSAHEIRLQYPPASAGRLMDPLATTLPIDITVEEAFRRLRKLPNALIYHVFVLDRNKHLAGFLTLRQLMTADAQDQIATVMQDIAGVLHPEMSRAVVLTHPAWKIHPILPVTTAQGAFLGTISYRTLKLLEDAERMTGEVADDTGAALGELYWLGLMAVFKGAITSLKSTEDGPSA